MAFTYESGTPATLRGTDGNDVLIQVDNNTGASATSATRVEALEGNDSMSVTQTGGLGVINEWSIFGGEGNDTVSLLGSPTGTLVQGGQGNDSVSVNSVGNIGGGAIDSSIRGGAGNDTIRIVTTGVGSVGTTYQGGSGSDQLFAQGVFQNANIRGGGDDDTIWFTADSNLSNTSVSGGSGNDTITNLDQTPGSATRFQVIANDNSTIFGGGGSDFIDFEGNVTDLLIYGGTGTESGEEDGGDIINGGDGEDTIYGQDGDDVITANAGDDTVEGNSGNDYINGNDGDDTILGQDGADTIFGDADDDVIDGGSGADSIYGGENADYIFGDSGNDTIYGEAGRDTILGGTNDDLISGGSDADLMSGGTGFDDFTFDSLDGESTISGFVDTDASGTVSDSDVFNFGAQAKLDIITDFTSLVDDLASVNFQGALNWDGVNTTTVDLYNGGTVSVWHIQGDWNATTGQFQVQTLTGQDTLVLYGTGGLLANAKTDDLGTAGNATNQFVVLQDTSNVVNGDFIA